MTRPLVAGAILIALGACRSDRRQDEVVPSVAGRHKTAEECGVALLSRSEVLRAAENALRKRGSRVPEKLEEKALVGRDLCDYRVEFPASTGQIDGDLKILLDRHGTFVRIEP
ncbi:MAG: hypothetical protein K8J08_16515 [Thermoanaerobaculia bacterium]|nr:hypothetical protein [Thermoanaerobaculia bacterium]